MNALRRLFRAILPAPVKPPATFGPCHTPMHDPARCPRCLRIARARQAIDDRIECELLWSFEPNGDKR